ncbi:bifunctional diguanylate cyclase/phosphodiesterase [Nitrincola tapanii]|uniref:cyclic-guanylate-specific phosphodiesterase n=1 Tax=Nitrincola tapanii TaxID=1708751 RepID=A0A5A9W8W1_9GAMM|nr:EAL domain-containing protein [Nitrincola tapanii]KAA0876568.1 EAL domain-containing protein [Nitrincola tapanii]
MSDSSKHSPVLRAERVALTYFVFAMLWILTSDYLLGGLISDSRTLVSLSMFKGIFFVCTTSALLYLVLRVTARKNRAEQSQSMKRSFLWVAMGLMLLVPLLSVSTIQLSRPLALQQAGEQLSALVTLKSAHWEDELSRTSEVLAWSPLERQALKQDLELWPLASQQGQFTWVTWQNERWWSLDATGELSAIDLPISLSLLHTQTWPLLLDLEMPETKQLSAWVPLGDEGWLLAEQSYAQIYQPVYQLVIWVALLALATAVAVGGALHLVWRQSQRWLAAVKEVEWHAAHEAELLHQRNLYNTLSQTNQTIIRSTHEAKLFQDICDICIRYGGLKFAWIGRLDEENHLHPVAQAGQDQGFIRQHYARVEIETDSARDPVSLAAIQLQPVICDRLNQDCPYCQNQQVASSASFPIVVEEGVYAVLSLYADEDCFFSQDIVATLLEMTSDIAFAIRFLEQGKALQSAVRVIEASPVVLFRWELDSNTWPVSYVSQNVRRWGYQVEQFLSGQLNYADIVHPDDAQRVTAEVEAYLQQEGIQEYFQEYRICCAQGEVIWVEDHTRVVRNEQGEIQAVEGVVSDISQRKENQQRLDYLAHHDSLTGLYNRLQVLDEIAAHAHPNTALLMLDLDRFKDVNDTFGHETGDQLLCQVAQLLQREVPETATLARLGGDEFALLLEAETQDLMRLAKHLIAILQTPILLPEGMEIRIGACVGISRYIDCGRRGEELLRQADTALYKAKEAGRGQVCFYSDEQTRASRERLEIEARLRLALERQELKVVYQPQIDLKTGELVGAEALLRWFDPQQGAISPAHFIPIAEQSGLILRLGHWVLEQVCEQGLRWQQQGYAPLTLAVNLSPYQVRHGKVLAMVQEVLASTGYPAQFLELELTESALMRQEDEAETLLDELKALGVSLALDDFGTGYSSLAYLKTFPIDVLKIDKSFVDDLESNQDDREIAATIVAMGHTLGLKVLAEGVETEEQFEWLRSLGCDYFQGYLKSPAVSAEEFVRFLQPKRDEG